MEAITAEGISVHFEGLVALDTVDLTLPRGRILGLIGPNGAGKTTLLNVLSGFQRPAAGSIRVGEDDVTRWPAHAVARLGVGRTFQGVRLFPDMTVLENVELGAIGRGFDRETARREAGRALDLLDLTDKAHRRAATLPYGEERLIGVARALTMRPRFLLLDEPAAGLSQAEAQALLERVASIRDAYQCGVLVIEHNMQLIMRLCEHIHVLAQGRAIAEGNPEAIQTDAAVREAYLGVKGDGGARASVKQPGDQPGSALPEILAVDALTIAYGPIRALDSVSVHVQEGELAAVVGPNGAGKSSLMNAITGFVRPRDGDIRFRGGRLDGQSPEKRVAAGIALVPEGRRVFPTLTVEENLKATHRRRRHGTAEAIDRHLTHFPQLRERWKTPAGKLSGGEQQQLAIARALLLEPSLLLLDEPSLGLAPTVIDQVYETLERLNRAGLSILLVEQNATRVLEISDRVYILRNGRVELSGPTADVASDERFGQAYFGF